MKRSKPAPPEIENLSGGGFRSGAARAHRRGAIALAALLGLLLGAAGPAAAQIRMRIVGPGSTQIPIAVSQLKDLGGGQDDALSQRFVKILDRDLKLSNYFKVIPATAYIEDPQKSGYDLGQINFADWSSLNAEFLVKGAVKMDRGTVTLEALLFDVSGQQRMMGKKFSGPPSEVPVMARRFADALMKSITGTRGPFNSEVAYSSTRAGRYKEIFTSWMDGGSLFQITNNPTINLFPSFDRGAHHLLYLSYKSGTPALYLVDLAARRERAIRNPTLGQMIGGTLLPGGDRLIAAITSRGYTRLFLLDTDGHLLRELTRGPEIDVSPAVSLDGSELAFTSDRSGQPQIYVMPLAGGAARRVTYQGSYNTTPAFSPDGRELAYQSRSHGRFDIYIIPVAGGAARRVTDGVGSNEYPCWSPDGRYIAFTSNRSGRGQIYLLQVSSGNISRLTEDRGNDTSPAWSGWLGE